MHPGSRGARLCTALMRQRFTLTPQMARGIGECELVGTFSFTSGGLAIEPSVRSVHELKIRWENLHQQQERLVQSFCSSEVRLAKVELGWRSDPRRIVQRHAAPLQLLKIHRKHLNS